MLIGLDGNEANVKNRVGSGQYAYSMLAQFAKNKSHDFIVYLKEKPLSDLPTKTSNYKYQVFGPTRLWTQFALPIKLTFSSKIDLFFTLGHYGPRFSRVPYAITIFDLSYLHFPELFNKDDLYQLINWSKYSIKAAKHIFAISTSTKDDIIKNYDINPNKISITHMGYNEELFKLQPTAKIKKVKEKYAITGDYIIFVGTLQPRKNVESLLKALKLIDLGIKLVVVGKKGWLFDSIFKKVRESKLEANVIFTDYVTQQELPALISGAKLYVLPSLYEGFGIPVIEAQACGVPTVVSNTSSLPEVVGKSGVLIDPTDSNSIAKGIKKILSSEKLSQDLVKMGYENVKRFSWEKCAAETLKVLESLNR
ncbi:MAG: glycosyltransferase family 1 protein [Patescibacteria group bacterium]